MEGGEEVEGTREEGRSHQQWESALTTHLVVVGATNRRPNKLDNKTGADLKAVGRRWRLGKCTPSSECSFLLLDEEFHHLNLEGF